MRVAHGPCEARLQRCTPRRNAEASSRQTNLLPKDCSLPGCRPIRSTWPLQRMPGAQLQVAVAASSGGSAGPQRPGAPEPPSTAAKALAAESSVESNVECIGTGMEVACTVNTWEKDSSSDGAEASSSGSASGQDEAQPLKQAADLALLVSPFFFWGSSMVAMKVLGPHTSPLFVGAFRLVPAGAALVGWAAASGRKQPAGAMAWITIAVFALFDGAFFQGFLAKGLQLTSAGLGSIIIDSQPITVALLASLFLGERLKPAGYGGLALGVLGLLLLEVPPDVLTTGGLPMLSGALESLAAAGGAAASGSIWDSGEWWMLLAAQSMAIGTVLVPWVSRYVDPVMATGWHLILGGLPLAALSALQESAVLEDRLPQLTGLDIALLLYVSLLGSAASYGVFFYNASRGNLTALSSLTFLTPCFAAGLGYLMLGETLTPLQLAGGAVTLAAVTMVNNNHAPSEQETQSSKAKQE